MRDLLALHLLRLAAWLTTDGSVRFTCARQTLRRARTPPKATAATHGQKREAGT